MERRPRTLLIPVLLFVAVCIVALNALLAFRSLEAMETNQRMVAHTWQVINQVERIMSSAKDAETGDRGYLITQDPAYLAPYTSALQGLPRELDSLERLTADNPQQHKRLPLIRAVLQQRLMLLAQSIELRRVGQFDSLRAMMLTGTGEAQMNNLRRIADEAESEEQRLLQLRTRQARTSSLRARFTLLLASGLDLLLIVLMSRYISSERAQRIKSELTAQRLAVTADNLVTTAENLATSRLEVERKAEEILALNVTLEERVRQRTLELENTNRELEAFSYSVSHDLRAPLRTVDGFSLALEEDYADAVDAVGKDYIKRVRAGVQRMGSLIDALLQLSRITRAEITREHIDLSLLANEVAADLREEERGRELNFTVESGLEVDADAKLLRVALENLFGNAVKFTSKKEHPQIHFGWNVAEQAWFIEDNGAGFDMQYAAKLFSAFNRLHGDKDFKGSGIGLATVARVIHRHHGRIWAQSEVDHGTTFFFTVGLGDGE